MVAMSVAMLRAMAREYDESADDLVLKIEEASGVDAYGMIVTEPPGPNGQRRVLVTQYGAVRIA
jgi:nitrous oxide reductase accessory protein NosL